MPDTPDILPPPPGLFDPARHEALAGAPWNEAEALAGIQRIAAATLADFSPARLWPPHAKDNPPKPDTRYSNLYLGAGGLIVMLVLAIPAFREVDEGGWLNKGQFSVTFLDRYGNEIGKRGIRHDDAVPLEEIPDYLIKATLATEDRRFFEHFGVDVIGTLRALSENMRHGETVQGGSTLTQQLAKNLFLSSERSLQRKIKEAYLALWLESRLTKQEILKLYLDRAYMGGGAFGVPGLLNLDADSRERRLGLGICRRVFVIGRGFRSDALVREPLVLRQGANAAQDVGDVSLRRVPQQDDVGGGVAGRCHAEAIAYRVRSTSRWCNACPVVM